MKKIIGFIKANKVDFLCVSAIFLIALILRIIAIYNYGAFTQDEPYSWRFASYNSIFEVIKQVFTVDVHMPLYFVYLHIWINIFGDSQESLHFSSLFLFLPIIPFVFYLMKKCFNKISAYFAIILLALSTYCVYFSIFVRFYSATMLFGILFTYYFLRFCEKFEKKYAIGLIISHFLLFYTYNLSIILTFCSGIIGLIYVLKYKKEYLKKFINIFTIIVLVSLPGIAITFYNVYATSKTICSHGQEFFNFNIRAILDLLENFLSNENYQINNKAIGLYRDFFILIKNQMYFLCVAIPIFIGIFSLIKSLFSKNPKLYLLLVPSILTFIIIFTLSSQNILYYQTKYMIFIFPMIICALAYGFTCFKEIIIGVAIFIFYFLFNFTYTLVSNTDVFEYRNNDLRSIIPALEYGEIKKTDLFISPFLPEVVKYFHKGKVTTIPFAFDEGLLIKDKKSLEFYFGEELLKKITRENVLEIMYPYIMNDIPMPTFEKNLYEQYFSKMEKGQKFILFNGWESTTGDSRYTLEKAFNLTEDNYYKSKKFILLSAKAMRDCYLIANKHLKFVEFLRNRQDNAAMYIFIKE